MMYANFRVEERKISRESNSKSKVCIGWTGRGRSTFYSTFSQRINPPAWCRTTPPSPPASSLPIWAADC
jgi:hypothetical protein